MEFQTAKEEEAKAFAEYLQANVRLDVLETMTTSLDEQLADSRQMMSNIKAMFDSIRSPTETQGSGNRAEELSQLLEAGKPQLLMPDMTNDPVKDVDVNNIVAVMKTYAEDLKKNYTHQLSPTFVPTNKSKEITSLNLQQYVSSLELLGKRLANIKLNRSEVINNRNLELEDKLTKLCQNVNMFTKLVESKTTLGEHNKNWSEIPPDNRALYYDQIIDKLLAGINEVTYLLQNKN